MDKPETRLTEQNLEHSELHAVGYRYSQKNTDRASYRYSKLQIKRDTVIVSYIHSYRYSQKDTDRASYSYRKLLIQQASQLFSIWTRLQPSPWTKPETSPRERIATLRASHLTSHQLST